MTQRTIDLKQLLYLIKENKADMQANLILDEGCTISADDPKPLIKIINYLINYLHGLTTHPLEISLDLHADKCTLGLLAFVETKEFPPLSENLQSALQDFNASLEKIHEENRYLLFKVIFNK